MRVVFERDVIRGLSQVGIRRTDIEHRLSSNFGLYSMLQDRRVESRVRVNAMYKSVAKKIRPVDSSETTGEAPISTRNWQEVVRATERTTNKNTGAFSK